LDEKGNCLKTGEVLRVEHSRRASLAAHRSPYAQSDQPSTPCENFSCTGRAGRLLNPLVG
jgi:hypothetical protein